MQLSWKSVLTGAILVLAIAAGQPAQSAGDAKPAGNESPPKTEGKAADGAKPADANRFTREGLTVEFAVRPVKSGSEKVVAGDWADVTFRITDANTGNPLKGSYPAAWIDLAEAWKAKGDRPMSCRDRVMVYLQGIVGIRPMIDLNSHFLLVLNRDASISVIDPAVGITGITNLFGQINLDRPGADWTKTKDEKRLFVTMPLAEKVALVDTDTFKVVSNVDAGEQPTRAELQGDERYLWVGNNAPKVEKSGVTVIDTVKLERLAFIPTGKGHHEIAFSGGDRRAFVSNRDDGTVSVIDVKALAKVKDIKTGPRPISLGFSPLAKALYVADGKTGTVAVVDPATFEIRARIETAPGLGPLRFSQDGRWGIVVNPAEDKVFVIDASTNRLAHTIPVGKKPYQVNFTRSFAYIRSLGTELVGLIPMSELEGSKTPPVTNIPVGQGPPGKAAEISIADSIVPSVKHAAVYVVNQAEGTVSYYMEGMAAPMGAFRNYGHHRRGHLRRRLPDGHAAPGALLQRDGCAQPEVAGRDRAHGYRVQDRRPARAGGQKRHGEVPSHRPSDRSAPRRYPRRDRAVLRRRRARAQGGAGPIPRGRPVRGRRQDRPGDHLLPVRGVAVAEGEVHGPAVREPDGDPGACREGRVQGRHQRRPMRGVAGRAAAVAVLLVHAGAFAQGIHPGDAVRVNGVAISYQRFAAFYQEYRRSKMVAVGASGFQVPLLDRLRREAMDLMIEQEVVRQAAEREGIEADKGEVDAEVDKLRSIFDGSEAFSRRLAEEGFTGESYRKHVAGMLAAGVYLDRIRAAVPEVSDEELLAYYRDNEYRLTFPEEVRVRHILLTWKPLGTGDDRAAIRGQMAPILGEARGGADFAELARAHSQDAETAPRGGDTGFFRRGQMVPAFEEVAFALAPGEVSDMVETPFGVHILRLEERRPERLLPLDEIREKLRDHVRRERMEDAVRREIERLRATAEISILVPL
jgi:YVTN family beta-propeller protein